MFQANTEYEVFIIPFYKSVLGLPSAIRLARTLAALPTQAPTIVNATVSTSGILSVHWKGIQVY